MLREAAELRVAIAAAQGPAAPADAILVFEHFDAIARPAQLQRRDKARQLKQGMMQELLTGRTRLV